MDRIRLAFGPIWVAVIALATLEIMAAPRASGEVPSQTTVPIYAPETAAGVPQTAVLTEGSQEPTPGYPVLGLPAVPESLLSAPQQQATKWERKVTMRRFRFRKIRAVKWAEGICNIAVLPVGKSLLSTTVRKLPQASNYWGLKKGFGEGIRRSKKKCDDGNDQSCGQLGDPAKCRWFNAKDEGVFVDYARIDQFCPDLEVCARWYELDPNKAEKAKFFTDNTTSMNDCLKNLFDSNSSQSSVSVCGTNFNPSWTPCNVVDYVSNNGMPGWWLKPQLMGDFNTGPGAGDTPRLSYDPASPCHWADQNHTWWGDIQNPWYKTAQVEFDVKLTQHGCLGDNGPAVSPCMPCPDATPQSALDLYNYSFFEMSACEISGTVYTANTNLRNPAAFIGLRRFQVYFDIDNNPNTGAVGYPACGAEYYTELALQSNGAAILANRYKFKWQSGAWTQPADQSGMYDVDMEDCNWSFTINKQDIGSPNSALAVWVVTRDGSNNILDVMPANPCTNRVSIPLNFDSVCPEVESVDASAVESGTTTAEVKVTMSEAIVPPSASDVTIVGPAGPAPSVLMNWNRKVLRLVPQSSWAPGHYTITLAPGIMDCAGNQLKGDGQTCGTPYTFTLCVPNTALVVRNSYGQPEQLFQPNAPVYLTGTGQPYSGSMKAWVMDDDIILQNNIRLIDETSDGPTLVQVTGGNIASTNLGTCPRPGHYAVILDVDGDGWYSEQTDATPNACEGTFAVQPCDDTQIEGLQVWFPFNETYPNAVPIEAASGSDATWVGSPTPGPGKVVNAWSFNGNNYVTVQPNPEMQVPAGEDFSVSGWIKPTAAASGIQSILDNRDNTEGYHVALVSGKLVMNISTTAGWTNYTSTASIPDNVWTHFVCSNDRTNPNSLRIYLNGALDHTYDATNRAGDLTSTFPMSVGGHNFTPGWGFKGAIDELAVWDGALTLAEVNLLYQAGERGASCPDSAWAAGIVDPPEEDGPGSVPGTGLEGTNSPNPFGTGTTINFAQERTGPASVRILDVSGRLVRTLESDATAPGLRQVFWDGSDDAGRRLPAGIYFWNLSGTGAAHSRKMIMLK